MTGSTPSFSPLYRQIKSILLLRLQQQQWRPAEAIPSELELARELRVSQGTVRKAIEEMVSERLLVRRQGKGTFVATHATQQVQTRFLRLVSDSAHSGSESDTYDPSGKAILVDRTITVCTRIGPGDKPTASIAAQLNLRKSDSLLYIQRVLAYKDANGQAVPTILEDIWLPAMSFSGLTIDKLRRSNAPLYAMFEAEYDVHMTRAIEKIRAINPDAKQQKLLNVKANTPLLSVERLAYTYNEVPMEVRRGLYRTDARHYRNELT